jgi:hypothetical protein
MLLSRMQGDAAASGGLTLMGRSVASRTTMLTSPGPSCVLLLAASSSSKACTESPPAISERPAAL